MALPDLTGQNIEDTYQRVLQTDDGILRDGTGSLVTLTDFSSLAVRGVTTLEVSGSTELRGNPTIHGDVNIVSQSFILDANDNQIIGSNDQQGASGLITFGGISSPSKLQGLNIQLSGNVTASGNISASGTITANSFTGNGLSIDGPSNSHIEVGEYPIGFDFLELPGSGLIITGSGLIISGAMADANHHNMLKIGNVELIDLNTAFSTNEFLIHNVSSFKMTSGSDGGDVANATGVLLEHNGGIYKLYKNNIANITATGTSTTISDTDILINAVNGPIFRALNSTTSTYLAGFDSNPASSATQNMRSIAMSNIYPVLGGAVTASAVSARGTITAASFIGTMDGGFF